MEKVVEFSRKIWKAIQEEDDQFLLENVHQEAPFVHMGVTLLRDDEIDTVKNRRIVYKEVNFEKHTVHDMGATVVVLNTLTLTAGVGGHDVTNHFVVTEVYTNDNSNYKLASLSFTKVVY